MSETAQLALITMLGSVLTGLIAAIPGILGYLKGRQNAARLDDVAATMNGHMTNLIAKTDALAHAEGVIEGGKAEGVLGEARRIETLRANAADAARPTP